MNRAEKRRQERAKAKQAKAKSPPPVYSGSELPKQRIGPATVAIHIEGCENSYVSHNVSVGYGTTVEIVNSKNITTERNINIP